MQRLVNVAHVMGQQNESNGLGDLPFILFRDSSSQDFDTIWNHVHHIPFAAPGLALGIFLHPHDGNVCVVKPMMRRHR